MQAKLERLILELKRKEKEARKLKDYFYYFNLRRKAQRTLIELKIGGEL